MLLVKGYSQIILQGNFERNTAVAFIETFEAKKKRKKIYQLEM